MINAPHLGLGGSPDLGPEAIKKMGDPTLNRLGLAATLPGSEKLQQSLLQQTVKQWIAQAQPGMRKSIPTAQLALKGAAELPTSIRAHWQGRMQLLINLASPPREDPIAVLRLINNIEPEVKQLQGLSLPTNLQTGSLAPGGGSAEPGTHPSVKLIVQALETFRTNIGQGHPYVQYTDRFANFNKQITAREGHIVRTFLFLAGVGGFILSGILAFAKRNEDPNWTLPMVYLGVAALAMGWGDFMRSGTERLATQIGWLTTPGGDWDRLQREYSILGPDWATFVRSLYEQRSSNAVIAAAMTSPRPLTDPQRKAVLALAPAGIRESVTAMLNSGPPPLGRDFRGFTGFLNRASTQETRNIVLSYLQSGTTSRSLAMLAQQPGTQEKLKKAGTDAGPPPTTTAQSI